MPSVGGKTFSYSDKGKAQAAAYSKATGKKETFHGGLKMGSKAEEAGETRGQEKQERKAGKQLNFGKAKKGNGAAKGGIKTTGTYKGKSNALGMGGRAQQMRDQGVPGGVIGAIARREGAAPGGPNFHKGGK